MISARIHTRLCEIEKQWVTKHNLCYSLRQFISKQHWYKSRKFYKFKRKIKRGRNCWFVYTKGRENEVSYFVAPDDSVGSITDMLRRIVIEYGGNPDWIKRQLANMDKTDKKRKAKRKKYLTWKANHKKREEAGYYAGLNQQMERA